MVVQSSVEAVEEALKKQQEAEKRMCSLELLMKMERRGAAAFPVSAGQLLQHPHSE